MTLCMFMQFMQDAQEVMGMLVKVQREQGQMEPDDPQVRDHQYLLSFHVACTCTRGHM